MPIPSFPRRRESIAFISNTLNVFSCHRNLDFSRAKSNKTTGLNSRFLLNKPPIRELYRKWALLIILALAACTQQKPTLNIAVASNFEPTLKKIIQQYPNKKYKINIIAGSSGVLTNQILNNAPYDLFLSADTDKPELIYKKLNLKTKPTIYAIGQLSLWLPNSKGNSCLEQLSTAKTLAMPNPKTAPYGKSAQSLLNINKIKVEKTIQTSNASQSYIYTKDRLTEAGFMPYSMSMVETKGCLEVFGGLELEQSMILLNEEAEKFYRYIDSSTIKKIIRESGYL